LHPRVDDQAKILINRVAWETCQVSAQKPPGEPLEQRIDYQFLAGGNARIISAGPAFNQPADLGGRWQWPSDHIGLLVELEP
jgi:hypothetical protein